MPILKLNKDDEQKELDFELEWQRQLSVTDRFALLEEKRRTMLQQLIDHGHRKPAEIIKRS
jgi:hypothetical protein